MEKTYTFVHDDGRTENITERERQLLLDGTPYVSYITPTTWGYRVHPYLTLTMHMDPDLEWGSPDRGLASPDFHAFVKEEVKKQWKWYHTQNDATKKELQDKITFLSTHVCK